MIPSRSDINIDDSLDEQWAEENFFEKSKQEAELMFRDNALRYTDDLYAMGPKALVFYLEAAVDYIVSDHSSEDSGAVSCPIRHRSEARAIRENKGSEDCRRSSRRRAITRRFPRRGGTTMFR